MPLSLKATVTHRQPEPDNPDMSHPADNADSQLVEDAQEGPNEGATAPAAEKSGKQLRREAAAAVNALQAAFLCHHLNKVVSVFLINGIRLVGKLKQFDQFTLLLEDKEGTRQLVFKHAVSTIQPPARRPGPREESHD